MTREQYASLPLSELKEIAKARGLKGTSTMKKGDLIQLMLDKDEEGSAQKSTEKNERKKPRERSARNGQQRGRRPNVREFRICRSWTADKLPMEF